MTRDITPLRPGETMAFDHARLARVCDEYGHLAEAHIAYVLSEIEALVLTAVHQRDDISGLRRSCGDLVRLCDGIGMATLAVAGRALLDCLETGDRAAFGACHARLERLGRPDGLGGWRLDRGTGRESLPDTVA